MSSQLSLGDVVVRQAQAFVLSSVEFREAVDDAFEAVADTSGGDPSFLGGLLGGGGDSGGPGVGRSAAGHVATRAFAACAAPLQRAGLPVPAPTAVDINAVFKANSANGAVLRRDEFQSFCAELLVRSVGRMIHGAARTFGPPILAGIGAVWLLQAAVRSTLSPLHRLISPMLFGPVLGIYVACSQPQPPSGGQPPHIDLRELQERASNYAAALREIVREQARAALRQWREANRGPPPARP